MRIPFTVFGDFELIMKPIHAGKPNPEMSYTKQYQTHVLVCFCCYTKCFDGNIYSQKPVTYTAQNENENVAQKFVYVKKNNNIKSIYQIFVWPKIYLGIKKGWFWKF